MPRPLSVAAIVTCLVVVTGCIAAGAATPAPSPGASGAATVGGSLPTQDAIDKQLAAALQQQQALQATKLQLAQEISVAQGEKTQLGQLVDSNRRQITNTLQQLDVQQRAVADATRRAADAHAQALAAREQADADRAMLAQVLRTEYEQSDGFIGWLLGATSLSDFLDRASRARQLLGGGHELVEDLRTQEAKAQAEEADAEVQEKLAADAATALEATKQQLEDETAKEQALMDQLDTQTASAAQELKNVDGQTLSVAQQVAALRIAQLDRVIADSEQAVWDDAQFYLQHNLGTLPDAPPGTFVLPVPGAAPTASAGHPLAWPAPGSVVSQDFGPSANAFEPPAFGYPHFHTGIDLAAPMGTPIYAAASGIVVSASPGTTGYGNHIVIATDRHVLCLYGHLQTMLVKVGDTITQGQLIALMGSTGNSTGPHLHFEVRVDGTPIDPAPLLSPPPAKS